MPACNGSSQSQEADVGSETNVWTNPSKSHKCHAGMTGDGMYVGFGNRRCCMHHNMERSGRHAREQFTQPMGVFQG